MLTRPIRFLKNTRATVAVEFAFIAPVLLLLFFGAIEITDALDARARVSNAVSTAADLTAQASTVTTSDLANVAGAVAAILYPHASTNAGIVISSVVDNNTGNGAVAWSYASNSSIAAKRATGTTVSLPSGLVTSGSGQSVIVAEIVYKYAPPTTQFITGVISMTGTFYSRPRLSTTVTCSNCN
jgi:Flp pilus assembly protein TadG